jgi:O-acetyl-ADP-ribose deacetylase (regulator of RNase III)
MVMYVKGDATKPQGDGKKIIAHVCNDEGGWGAGFVLALDRMSPLPRISYLQEYKYWTKNEGLTFIPLGLIQVVSAGHANPDVEVCNMIAQHRTIRNVPKPICYKSLEVALTRLAEEAIEKNATVHMPRIGCGLAGGDWNVVESIINRTLTLRDIDVTVYNL